MCEMRTLWLTVEGVGGLLESRAANVIIIFQIEKINSIFFCSHVVGEEVRA